MHFRSAVLRPVLSLRSRGLATGRGGRPKVLVVGCGWGGARVIRDLDPNKFDIRMISPRNHMIFTPMLPQTATGTLEFRSVLESVDRLQPELEEFHGGIMTGFDAGRKVAQCIAFRGAKAHDDSLELSEFELQYDHLVLAHGASPITFDTPGVTKNAFYMRESQHARAVRKRFLQNVNHAFQPGVSESERARLLHTVVVGGGPTGVEFAADMADMQRKFASMVPPEARQLFKLTLINPGEVLQSFDEDLRRFASRTLQGYGIGMVDSAVSEVHEDRIELKDGTMLPYGLCVWSTGVGPSFWTENMSNVAKTDRGRVAVDGNLRALAPDGSPVPDVYALGDAAGDYPTLAAVAMRQGAYVAALLNESAMGKPLPKPFSYRHLGSMVSLGPGKALIDLPGKLLDIKGFFAFLGWRSAYFTMLGSIRSRLYVAINWISTTMLGRDYAYIPDDNEVRKACELLDKKYEAGGKLKRFM